jgi:Fur family zinc uptake transcriptional regulator
MLHEREAMIVMDQEVIIQAMSEQGLRITEQRKSLAKLFAEADGYLAPKDVYAHMEKLYTGLSFDTVYRNLRVLHEMDVLEQFVFEDGIRFKAHCGGHAHHHHLICLSCEKTIPVDYCPMPQLSDIPNHFQVVRHKFEVFGYCEDCHDTAEPHTEPLAKKVL